MTRTSTGGVTINGAISTVISRNGFDAGDSQIFLGARYFFSGR